MSRSRVARKPVIIPAGTIVDLRPQELTVKGPKGSLTVPLDSSVSVEVVENSIHIKSNTDSAYCRNGSEAKKNRSMPGTMRATVFNMVIGVTTGFERKIILIGVGYKAQKKDKVLILNLGFSHPVEFSIPEGVEIDVVTPTELLIKGTDNQLVGYVAAEIRSKRPPELYKGKGVRYANEVIVLKDTKKK